MIGPVVAGRIVAVQRDADRAAAAAHRGARRRARPRRAGRRRRGAGQDRARAARRRRARDDDDRDPVRGRRVGAPDRTRARRRSRSRRSARPLTAPRPRCARSSACWATRRSSPASAVPGPAELDALVERARLLGVDTRLTVTGDPWSEAPEHLAGAGADRRRSRSPTPAGTRPGRRSTVRLAWSDDAVACGCATPWCRIERRGLGPRSGRDGGAGPPAGWPVRGRSRRRRVRGERRAAPSAGSGVMTSVVIVDDQAMVRQGLRLILELAGIEVLAEAEDGAQGVAAVREHEPDVVLDGRADAAGRRHRGHPPDRRGRAAHPGAGADHVRPRPARVRRPARRGRRLPAQGRDRRAAGRRRRGDRGGRDPDVRRRAAPRDRPVRTTAPGPVALRTARRPQRAGDRGARASSAPGCPTPRSPSSCSSRSRR